MADTCPHTWVHKDRKTKVETQAKCSLDDAHVGDICADKTGLTRAAPEAAGIRLYGFLAIASMIFGSVGVVAFMRGDYEAAKSGAMFFGIGALLFTGVLYMRSMRIKVYRARFPAKADGATATV